MADPDIWVPIAFFLAIVATIAIVMYYRTERAKVVAASGGQYQKLAEEAVRGQRVLLDEIQRMNTTLQEIARLLREV